MAERLSKFFGDNGGQSAPVFSYSGSDFEIWAYFPLVGEGADKLGNNLPTDFDVSDNIIKFGNLQTITSSMASSKTSVDCIGTSTGRGYTRGQKTFAGSLIFSVLEKEPLRFLFNHFNEGMDADPSFITFDQLPPFSIVIQGSPEYLTYEDRLPPLKEGRKIRPAQRITKVIVGVELLQHGETISIDDYFLEQNHQYVAQYVTPWIDGEHGFSEILTRIQKDVEFYDFSPSNAIPTNATPISGKVSESPSSDVTGITSLKERVANTKRLLREQNRSGQ